jgi:hypothetical protein
MQTSSGAALFALTCWLQVSLAGALSCVECVTMQEAIHRSIKLNISALESNHVAGSQQTATVEIGQIIWHLCGSEAWRSMRYEAVLSKACKKAVREHTDLMTNYWKEKTSEEYKDGALALRMKRAICPNSDIGACELEQLPSDYVPLRTDECAVCRAMVSDLFAIVTLSRDRAASAKSDAYYRIVAAMGSVCDDLPMRHALRGEERRGVVEMCEDLWDEHEAALARLALRPEVAFAQSLCSDELELCDEPLALSELFAHGAPPARGKEEL